jgi:hypothetical protein
MPALQVELVGLDVVVGSFRIRLRSSCVSSALSAEAICNATSL